MTHARPRADGCFAPENILPASNAAPGLLAQQKEVRPLPAPCRRVPLVVLTFAAARETNASRLPKRQDRQPPIPRRPHQEGRPLPRRGPQVA